MSSQPNEAFVRILKERLYLRERCLIASVLFSSGSHGIQIAPLSDWNIKQPLGFSVTSSTGQWGVRRSCWLDVCVSVQGLILCFSQVLASPLSDFPALFAPNRIFHYQIPLLTLLAFCFRAFSFSRQNQLNATESSPPMWVHSYPSCPLKRFGCELFYSMCSWAATWAAWTMKCILKAIFSCCFYFSTVSYLA